MSADALLKGILLHTYILLPRVIRSRLCRNKVTILLYHQISPELFDSHIAFLMNHYNLIKLKRLKQFLYKKDNDTLPPNSLVVTFDDGWRGNFELLPVIRKYNCPVTIFLPTGLVGTRRKIWNYSLDRENNESELNEFLKNVRNQEKNESLLMHNGYFPEKEYQERDLLSFKEIERMSPYVDFQSHGQFHPVLTMCSDAELSEELSKSKEYIEKNLGHECYAIAYPYGRYDQRVRDLAHGAGYSLGRTTKSLLVNTSETDPYRLTAIGIDENSGVRYLGKKIALAELKTILRVS